MKQTSITEDTLIYARENAPYYHLESHVKIDGRILDGYRIISLEDAKTQKITLCPVCARNGK